MPDVRSIRALRYPTSAGGDLSSKIAPPYDVLDEGPKQDLLDRDPHNIVKIDLPVTPPKTVGPDEAYAGAGETLREWIDQGVLVRDDQPALFAYEQRWSSGDGQAMCRRGLFAAVGAEPFGRSGGGIHRHEMTIKSGTDDRLKLMEATATQLSPVFSIYDDAAGDVATLLGPVYAGAPKVVGRTSHDDVEHRCWIIDDPDLLASISDVFETRDVFIADGHHRYTTALNYKESHEGTAEASACLMVLVAQQDPGMIVLPTHRVLTGLSGLTPQSLAEQLESGLFELNETPHGRDGLAELTEGLSAAGPHGMGLFDPISNRTWTLVSRSEDPGAEVFADRPQVWRTLDVAVFHELFVDRVLRPAFGGDQIAYKYPHRIEDLVALCDAEPGRLGVLMQATPLESVIGVSEAGDVMPPKSTFFFPKLATGLVISPLNG
jgi:uncharacterized protein (DUF1015 family)